MMHWWWALALVVVGCTSSSGGDGDGGVGDGGVGGVGVPEPGEAGGYVTVTLRRTDGQYSLADLVALQRDTAPLLATDGELLAVGWKAGVVVDAGFITFPTAIQGETLGESELPEIMEDLSTDSAVTFELYAPDGLDQITVVDGTGTTVATLEVPVSPGALTEAEAWVPLPEAPWLAVIRPSGALSLLPGVVQGALGNVLDPFDDLTPASRERLVAALRLVEPGVFEGTRYVVIGTFRPDFAGLLGFALDSTLALRADLLTAPDRRLEFTVVHELAHTFDTFLGRSTNPRDVDAFLGGLDAEAANAARQRIQARIRHRLFDRSLAQTFGELMAVGRSLGLTQETYCGRIDPAMCWINQDERAYAAGAAIPYGVATLAEDVASWVHLTHALDATGLTRAHLCSELAAAQELTGRGHLLAYAKLAILRGVGVISEADFDACVGAFPIPAPPRPGIFLHKANGDVFELPTGVQAGWANVDGIPMFSVLAGTADGQYRGLIQVMAPGDRRFPRRLATLNDINLATVGLPLSGFFLAHEANPNLARASRSGLVLFTALSTERVEGVILFLELQSDLFVVTDTFEVGSFLWTP